MSTEQSWTWALLPSKLLPDYWEIGLLSPAETVWRMPAAFPERSEAMEALQGMLAGTYAKDPAPLLDAEHEWEELRTTFKVEFAKRDIRVLD
jgi:hypothetical protein